jgi:hypothetical protein
MDTQTGREYVWNGTRYIRREIYDSMTQEGVWNYDIGQGLFRTFVTYGTVQGFFLANSNRLATRFLTAAGANNAAGMRVPTLITRRANATMLVYTIQSGDISNTKHFHGLASYTTQIPVGAGVTNPFGTTDSGVMLGFTQGPNFKVFYHDGDGSAPPTPVDTGIAVAASNLYQFGLEFLSDRVIWSIANLNFHPQTYLGSGEILTDLPATSTSLAPHFHAESTSAGQINLYLATARLFQRG